MSANKKRKIFSHLFDKHYQKLFNYAFKLVGDKDLSDELVQEAFIKLWENIDGVSETARSLESYLVITLKNKIIDHFRKTKSQRKHNDIYTLNHINETLLDTEWDLSDCIHSIYTSLDKKTLEIFQLSREKGLTYKEIATSKNISVKTVELHISKALEAFRNGLKDFL